MLNAKQESADSMSELYPGSTDCEANAITAKPVGHATVIDGVSVIVTVKNTSLHSRTYFDGLLQSRKVSFTSNSTSFILHPGSLIFTTISSQQAVDGFLPLIPRNISSVVTFCL